ncbi:MAG TPA: catechol 1,2-dioxygenase [Burkholderiales bacterium]|nr:catechol 1,2-dioxygenase [Burkholderiales bacterium]
MPVIKVTDIAFGRLQSPSLDEAEEFLTTFGMVRAERTANALYMRGTDPDHHIHVTHLGPSKFIGLAFNVESEDDLARLARAPGASPIEQLDEPGGGKRVRITDPHGYQMEAVYGIKPLEPLPVRQNVPNWGGAKLRRAGELTRLPHGPSQVKRIGHGVIMTPHVAEGTRWIRETLGLISSDDVYAGSKDHMLATFNRCDRGKTFVDHHVFLCIEGPRTGLNHLSFEVQDFDDVMMGHEYIAAKGKYKHVWGIGRHVLGSQVFDYWQDPWGRVHEHWTDTDMLNCDNPPNLISAEEGLNSQWGDRAPEEFIAHCTP